jgi:hypothetical protein
MVLRRVCVSLVALQGAEMSLGTKLKCCWEAAIGVWPFILICFVMPMVNSQLMQLAQQPEFGNVSARI